MPEALLVEKAATTTRPNQLKHQRRRLSGPLGTLAAGFLAVACNATPAVPPSPSFEPSPRIPALPTYTFAPEPTGSPTLAPILTLTPLESSPVPTATPLESSEPNLASRLQAIYDETRQLGIKESDSEKNLWQELTDKYDPSTIPADKEKKDERALSYIKAIVIAMGESENKYLKDAASVINRLQKTKTFKFYFEHLDDDAFAQTNIEVDNTGTSKKPFYSIIYTITFDPDLVLNTPPEIVAAWGISHEAIHVLQDENFIKPKYESKREYMGSLAAYDVYYNDYLNWESDPNTRQKKENEAYIEGANATIAQTGLNHSIFSSQWGRKIYDDASYTAIYDASSLINCGAVTQTPGQTPSPDALSCFAKVVDAQANNRRSPRIRRVCPSGGKPPKKFKPVRLFV